MAADAAKPNIMLAQVLFIVGVALLALTAIKWVLLRLGFLKAVPVGDGTAKGEGAEGTEGQWDRFKTTSRVADERAAGRLWRAKEILQGSIGSTRYDPELYRLYGETLLELGEPVEAGKYLFLGNSTDKRHKDAISQYLGPLKNSDALLASFPSRAKLEEISLYPEPLRSELAARGFRPRPKRWRAGRDGSVPQVWEWLSIAWALYGFVIFLLIVVVAVLGILHAFVGWPE